MPIAAPRYTVDDLDAFPDDGQHYELLDGVLLVTPAPALRHQVIVGRLAAALSSGLSRTGGLVVSPGRIERGRSLRLEPDILVFPSPAMADAGWTDVTSWWLAVEVLSPSTRVYDTEWKRQAYQGLGVETVWLVDARRRNIQVWTGVDSDPVAVGEPLLWYPNNLPEARVEIEVASLFA